MPLPFPTAVAAAVPTLAAALALAGAAGAGAGAAAADATDTPAGTGAAITRSLDPGGAVAPPFVGPGPREPVPVPQALDLLRQAGEEVSTLRREIAAAPPRDDRTGTPLGEAAQTVLGDAKRAVQAFQYTGLQPADSQPVREALTTISEAQIALLQDPRSAAPALDSLGDHLAGLAAAAEQAAQRRP